MELNIFFAAVFLGFLYSVNCLVCYECNSNKVEGCGVTFSIPEELHSKYLIKCNEKLENPTACRKSVVQEYDHQLVIRSCYNQTAKKGEDANSCNEMANAEFCYCQGTTNSEGEELPCNGQERQVFNAYLTLVLGLVATIVYLR